MSRQSHHLQNFNNLWTVRLLLVSFVSLWVINEVLRLPSFHRRHLYPFFPSLTLTQQANLCKFHLVLSLGFLEPGFLLTLLFLVNVSIRKRNQHDWSAITSMFIMWFPILLLQICFVYFSPFKSQLPAVMHRSFLLILDVSDESMVVCTYPLLSCIVFAAFAIAYSLGLLLSCWRVVAFVINKGTRVRIKMLVSTVMTALTMQILLLVLASLWPGYNIVVLAMFTCVSLCAAVGEVIAVIKPTMDALAAGGECCRWSPTGPLRPEVDQSLMGQIR
ncbi:unnamed protein product [Ilex paraguariensis]|uniref:SecY-independent transporter protein n=1 Tax=Ilex paraguariensis TaxID=185542 RepID=A0ABC8RU36_9AQUA